MLILQKILFLSILLDCQGLFAQSFKDDWTGFAVKNWTIRLSSDTRKFLDNFSPVGRIQIESDIDSTRVIRFAVFDKSIAQTSKFQKEINEWLFRQSCLSFNKENIVSFYYGDFYYFIQPCDNCFSDIKENKDCDALTKYIKSHYTEKP
jgi:hypothetical protein